MRGLTTLAPEPPFVNMGGRWVRCPLASHVRPVPAMDVSFLGGPRPQRGVGVVAPFDFALDRELWRWVPDDISLRLTRLPFFTTPVTVEMAVACGDRRAVRRATRDVLTPEPGVVAYACTSGSFVEGAAGEEVLRRTMEDAGAPAACTTSGALIAAL